MRCPVAWISASICEALAWALESGDAPARPADHSTAPDSAAHDDTTTTARAGPRAPTSARARQPGAALSGLQAPLRQSQCRTSLPGRSAPINHFRADRSADVVVPEVANPCSDPLCFSGEKFRATAGGATGTLLRQVGLATGRYSITACQLAQRHLPRRSCLSTPGSSDRFLAKAPTVAADMTFLDLEDSVAPAEKTGGPSQGRGRGQRPRLGRPGALRPGERLGHALDLRGRDRRGGRGRPTSRRGHAAQGAERRPRSWPSTCCSLRSRRTRVATWARGDRGPDRDHDRTHQRRVDLCRVPSARGDHLRSGRLLPRRWRCQC